MLWGFFYSPGADSEWRSAFHRTIAREYAGSLPDPSSPPSRGDRRPAFRAMLVEQSLALLALDTGRTRSACRGIPAGSSAPRPPAGAQHPGATMIYCSPERCALCRLIPGSAECLRKQAYDFLRLAKTKVGRPTHEDLEELSFDLMEKARAIEKKRAIPPAPVK